MLTGLENAKVYPPKLSIFRQLINTHDNYACYRAQWLQNPGLPFLRPHCLQLLHADNPGRVLSEIFLFVSYLDRKYECCGSTEDDLHDSFEDLNGDKRGEKGLRVGRRPEVRSTRGQLKRSQERSKKHAPFTPELSPKAKGSRSRKGCITCKKRKKKCDEKRPCCEFISFTQFSYRCQVYSS